MQVSFGGTVIQRRSVGEAAFSETSHDPLTQLARHAHARASFCFVVDGSFREHSARGSEDHGRHDVIFRPARAWHADAFSEEGRAASTSRSPRIWSRKSRCVALAINARSPV